MGITIRTPAAYRQIIYGERQVGGQIIFRSSTGSSKSNYNTVIILAGHTCDSIVNMYLDGRLVWWNPSSVGHSFRNGVSFGGSPDGADHTGPDGNKYNLNGNVCYCEPRFGDQLPGDVISGLTANDPTWAATPDGSPYVGGCWCATTIHVLQGLFDFALLDGDALLNTLVNPLLRRVNDEEVAHLFDLGELRRDVDRDLEI